MLFSPVNSQSAMQIPDGFLSVTVSVVFWVISIVVIGIALKKANKQISEKDVPLMGILAAAIFAGQMLNFSVSGGTSGHLLGAAIATILLGPWQAVCLRCLEFLLSTIVNLMLWSCLPGRSSGLSDLKCLNVWVMLLIFL